MRVEDYTYMLKKLGAPERCADVPSSHIEAFSGRVPDILLQFWKNFGLSMWLGRRLQFCDPDAFRPICRSILGGDPELSVNTTHIYAFSAFGNLLLWSESHQRLSIMLPRLWAEGGLAQSNRRLHDPDIAISAVLTGLDREDTTDWYEDTPTAPRMFKKVAKALGRLEFGEVYGFFPALELGGKAKVENVRRVPALEHFAILAQLGPVRLFDYSTGRQRFVRTLGGA